MEGMANNLGHKGQFLWMDNSAQEKYVVMLKKRIENGYYFSESIITRIVDELAPVMADTIHNE